MNAANIRQNGFSLIEVLIAVLVLAIGMLGLGAVFPAIIAEQRDSFEVVEGNNAAGAAVAMLSNKELIDFSLMSDEFNRASSSADDRYEYLWAVSPDGNSFGSWSTPFPSYNYSTGLWGYEEISPLIPAADRYVSRIPVAARIYPQAYSGKDPKFVWDTAIRREPSGDRVQAAIFVRRIDARIRVPRDYSLSDVLTGSNGVPNGQLLPVSINFTNGQPVADDGAADKVYAAIQSQFVEVYEEHLDWLIFTDGRDPMFDTSVGFATKVGQKLVDNTGVVRTVVGLPEVDDNDPLSNLFTTKRVVRVDPPFSPMNAGGGSTGDVSPGANSQDSQFDDERASWVRQVIFTPRTPVAVRVVTLEDNS